MKELATKLREGQDKTENLLSSNLWGSINAIVNEEESLRNPCRRALSLGNIEGLKGNGPKWRALSKELLKCLPSNDLAAMTHSCNRAKSLLSDIQSEVVVLRRQNELLTHAKRKKVEELASVKKNVKLLMIRITELEHNLSLSNYREKQAKMFLQHLRKVCWRLQADVMTGKKPLILDIAASIHGTPDLSGLVDLDSLMAEAGVIESLDVSLEEDDLPNDLLRNAHADNPHTSWFRPDSIQQNEQSREAAVTLPPEKLSPKERELKRDLRTMMNKCVELQLRLSEEKAHMDVLINKHGALKQKQLVQDVITLVREKSTMMHNAKVAMWKLQEVLVVNKVLTEKSKESSQHVTSLEEGFQRLQETFRASVLDFLDADTQLRERVAHLEAVVDSLTLPQTQTLELDALLRPVLRMNVPLRGRKLLQEKGSKLPCDILLTSPPQCLMPAFAHKKSEKEPASIVRRHSKHHYWSKKKGDAPTSRIVLRMGGLRRATSVFRQRKKICHQTPPNRLLLQRCVFERHICVQDNPHTQQRMLFYPSSRHTTPNGFKINMNSCRHI